MALNGQLGGGLWLAAHRDSPGESGLNEAVGLTAGRVSARFTPASSADALTFSVYAEDPIVITGSFYVTHVGVWTERVGGLFLGYDSVIPASSVIAGDELHITPFGDAVRPATEAPVEEAVERARAPFERARRLRLRKLPHVGT